MQFYELSPTVPANRMDPIYVEDTRVRHRTRAARMDFEYPMRTEIITSRRTYAVTESLAAAMAAEGLTGFDFGEITVSIAEWVEDLASIGEIPPLKCLDIWGLPLRDDLGLRAKDSSDLGIDSVTPLPSWQRSFWSPKSR